jgi:hypothetical protein
MEILASRHLRLKGLITDLILERGADSRIFWKQIMTVTTTTTTTTTIYTLDVIIQGAVTNILYCNSYYYHQV